MSPVALLHLPLLLLLASTWPAAQRVTWCACASTQTTHVCEPQLCRSSTGASLPPTERARGVSNTLKQPHNMHAVALEMRLLGFQYCFWGKVQASHREHATLLAHTRTTLLSHLPLVQALSIQCGCRRNADVCSPCHILPIMLCTKPVRTTSHTCARATRLQYLMRRLMWAHNAAPPPPLHHCTPQSVVSSLQVPPAAHTCHGKEVALAQHGEDNEAQAGPKSLHQRPPGLHSYASATAAAAAAAVGPPSRCVALQDGHGRVVVIERHQGRTRARGHVALEARGCAAQRAVVVPLLCRRLCRPSLLQHGGAQDLGHKASNTAVAHCCQPWVTKRALYKVQVLIATTLAARAATAEALRPSHHHGRGGVRELPALEQPMHGQEELKRAAWTRLVLAVTKHDVEACDSPSDHCPQGVGAACGSCVCAMSVSERLQQACRSRW